MKATVYIAPHECAEAVDAYRDYLTASQVEAIEDHCENGRIVGITIDYTAKKTVALVGFGS